MDAAWEPHKAEIERLYIKEGKTLEQVREILELERGFRRSKKQYEGIFQKWGFKKNLNPEKWKWVNRRVTKRKRDSRESDVYVYGEQLPRERIRKGITRYGFVSTIELYSAPSPETPEGIVVCTPEPSNGLTLEWPSELPWLRFLRETGMESRPDLPCSSTTEPFILHPDHCQNAIPILDLIGGLSAIYPEANIEDGSNTARVARFLRVVMPEEYNGQHDTTSKALLRTGDPIGQPECLKLMFYLLSNNIPLRGNGQYIDVSLENDDGLIMQMLQGLGLNTLENILRLLTSNVTASAVAERLFGSALRSADFNIVEMLLKANVSPDTPVLDKDLDPLTPLEYVAYYYEHVPFLTHQMTRLLLSHRADVKKHLGFSSALEIATSNKDKELMEILLQEGAEICSSTLQAAAKTSDTSIAKTLLDAASVANGASQFSDNRYESMLESAVGDEKIEMTKLLLSMGADVNAIRSVGMEECKTNVLGLAAYMGNIPMLKLLLGANAAINPQFPEGPCYCSPLALAVEHSDSLEVTRFLISRGANVNAAAIHRGLLGIDLYQTDILGLAASKGDVAKLDVLLAAKAVVNPRLSLTGEYPHHSPLAVAVYYEQEPAAKCLIASGANPNVTIALQARIGIKGRLSTLFQYALDEGQLEMCKILLNARALTTASVLQDYYSASLQDSILREDFESANQLLQSVQLNHVYRECTALGAAIEVGNVGLIITLQHAGATNLGYKLLRIGNLEMAKYLASAGTLHDMMLARGNRIMANAIHANDEELACYLLDWAIKQQSKDIVDVLVRGRDGHDRVNPLEIAISTKQLKLAKILVANGFLVTDGVLEKAVAEVLESGDDDIVRSLLDHIAPADFKAPSAVGLALENGNFSLVRTLLDAGIDARGKPDVLDSWGVRTTSKSVLGLAAENGHFSIFPALLESADWSKEDMGQALAWLFSYGQSTLIQDLLKKGADLDRQVYDGSANMNPLQYAVCDEDVPMIRTLIDGGCKLSHPTPESFEYTALQYAVRIGNLEIVDMLLQAGADINDRPGNVEGATAIQLAAQVGDIDLVNGLLERGADVNNSPAPYRGATALQVAAIKGFFGLARRLFEAGADINAGRSRYYGRTALEGAAEHGRVDMLHFLVENGALIEGRGRRQFIRAVVLAKQNGHLAASDLLRSYGQWTGLDARMYAKELIQDGKMKEMFTEEDCGNDLIDTTYKIDEKDEDDEDNEYDFSMMV